MKFVVILKYRRKIKTISYKKLWDLLIDRDMKKKDLMTLAGISQSFIIKMGHNDTVNTVILATETILPEEQA